MLVVVTRDQQLEGKKIKAQHKLHAILLICFFPGNALHFKMYCFELIEPEEEFILT